jgi:adenine deaminase
MLDVELLTAGLGENTADLVVANGRLVNVLTEEIYPADVAVAGSKVLAVGDVERYRGPETEMVDAAGAYLVPGLVDGHIHIECSKLSVTMFARAVVPFGTTSAVSGLDQILVVAGLEGLREFLAEAKAGPLKVFWGAPFKTPYTLPESTVGHTFGPREHEAAQRWPECVGVWETVQEFVLAQDPDVLAALALATENRLPVLGCAPMARGERIVALAAAGVRADHESYSAEEMLEKLRNGMHVMIRESSVAHFLAENVRVVTESGASTRRIAFCTDDVTASDVLRDGHLDRLIRMAIEAGVEPMDAIQMATLNCAEIYRIDDRVGAIAPGRFADILLVDDLERFRVEAVIANGRPVARDERMTASFEPPSRGPSLLRTFRLDEVVPSDLAVRVDPAARAVRVLAMRMDEEVPFVRKRRDVVLAAQDGVVSPDREQDVLYVTVVERYGKTGHRPVAFVSGFGLRAGAMASSAAPDDNNVVCVGVNPDDMALAVNEIVRAGGGQIVVCDGEVVAFLALPVGGIVADLDPARMAAEETRLDDAARSLGCRLPSPFMYLMFLAITAIPDYAITDLGLVDCVALDVVSPILGVVDDAAASPPPAPVV